MNLPEAMARIKFLETRLDAVQRKLERAEAHVDKLIRLNQALKEELNYGKNAYNKLEIEIYNERPILYKITTGLINWINRRFTP